MEVIEYGVEIHLRVQVRTGPEDDNIDLVLIQEAKNVVAALDPGDLSIDWTCLGSVEV